METEKLKIFEEIKQINQYGQEFWSARDLAKTLDYGKYSNFELVIKKAISSCKNSGIATKNHFADIGKMIEIGKTASRQINDMALSRYACYLIMQNADPSKEVEELAANLFRATQTDAKIQREKIKGEANANQAHFHVGRKIRQTIKELGGTMPELLPATDPISHSRRRLKNSEKPATIKS